MSSRTVMLGRDCSNVENKYIQEGINRRPAENTCCHSNKLRAYVFFPIRNSLIHQAPGPKRAANRPRNLPFAHATQFPLANYYDCCFFDHAPSQSSRVTQSNISMAAVETNGNGAVHDDASKPPEGVVVPPKDIRGMSCRFFCLPAWPANKICDIAIVEKTAGYVARNGPIFEREFASPGHTFSPRLIFLSRTNSRKGKKQPQILISEPWRCVRGLLPVATYRDQGRTRD